MAVASRMPEQLLVDSDDRNHEDSWIQNLQGGSAHVHAHAYAYCVGSLARKSCKKGEHFALQSSQ